MKPIKAMKAPTAKQMSKPAKTPKAVQVPVMKMPTIPKHRERLANLAPLVGGKGKKS